MKIAISNPGSHDHDNSSRNLLVVVSQTIENDLKCSIEKSKLRIIENKSPLLSLYFEDNIYLNFEPECNIQLTFTSLTDLPINDINSVNKTVLDLTQKSFININFKKL